MSRDADGTMHVKESGDHDVFKGSTIGVAGGLVVGLFAPPLLGAMVVGGLIGGLVGKLKKPRGEGIAKDVEDVCRPGPRAWSQSSRRSGWTRWSTSWPKPTKALKKADKETADQLKKGLAETKKQEA